MATAFKPWSPYEGRTTIVCAGHTTLTSAFADVVLIGTDFEAHELCEIFAAAEDEGTNDAARDMVGLEAEFLAQTFASGRLGTFARPLGGGEVVTLAAHYWNLDDPLPRFATGVLNLEHWSDHDAPPTHRLFVNTEEFEVWLAALKPPRAPTDREIAEHFDPSLRAARSIARRSVAQTVAGSAPSRIAALPADPPGVGPRYLSMKEVSKMIGRSPSSIYEYINNGTFPEQIKFGASSRWSLSEVETWVAEQAAKRGISS